MNANKTQYPPSKLNPKTWTALILLGFAVYFILFTVAFSMVPGPLIGGWLAARYGVPTMLYGQTGYIPTPLIFQVAGVATLVALIPLTFITDKRNPEIK